MNKSIFYPFSYMLFISEWMHCKKKGEYTFISRLFDEPKINKNGDYKKLFGKTISMMRLRNGIEITREK